MLAGARKDSQLVTAEWDSTKAVIDGLVVREVKHVPRDHGVITETYRPAWDPTGAPIVHIYQSRLFPGAIGAWSCHMKAVDRLFCNQGFLKVVLYDDREESGTRGMINELYVGDARPTFIVLPPGIWHGLQNVGPVDALVLNYPTLAYDYEDPDHWRLPHDTSEIPYEWHASEAARLRKESR